MKKQFLILIVIFSSVILMSSIVDLNNLFNYQNQDTPDYISLDNTPQDNIITDRGATLGRVLFYDKNLSINNTISCASCHLQEFAFGDTAVVSVGVNGVTGRHSMRLVNSRFSNEVHAFWDERALTFEDQATEPIRDHVEMGYSGLYGNPSIDDLIVKMEGIEYYSVLFDYVFDDTEITELKIQKAIAQFVRSIQSFDSRYDEGRAQVVNDQAVFPNFTDQENDGKDLFMKHPPLGGAGCARCHSGPEFSLISQSRNNGVIGNALDANLFDLNVTKAPSLRDLVNPEGKMNGPFMHDGSLSTLMDVLDHYTNLEEVPENTNLDFRLSGQMHNLELDLSQKEAIVAFLHTLTGSDIYTSEKLSDPFDENGDITIIPFNPDGIKLVKNNSFDFEIFPNPTSEKLNLSLEPGSYQAVIVNMAGKKVKSTLIKGDSVLNIEDLPTGTYIIQISDLLNNDIVNQKFIIE